MSGRGAGFTVGAGQIRRTRWGCLPHLYLSSDAHLHWFPGCGHFPRIDAAEETIELILDAGFSYKNGWENLSTPFA